MPETPSEIQSEIVEFIRDSFSSSGASVTSYGRGNVVVELPSDFPGISTMITMLSDTFDADCDLTTVGRSPQLTVWYPETRRQIQSEPERMGAPPVPEMTRWAMQAPKSKILVAFMFVLLVVLGILVVHSAAVVWSNARPQF
jgi:hypothetical protein